MNIPDSEPTQGESGDPQQPATEVPAKASRLGRPFASSGSRRTGALLLLAAYLLGIASGNLLWARLAATPVSTRPASESPSGKASSAHHTLLDQVNPPDGYRVSATYGELGPRLIAAGAIDEARFRQLYAGAGQPLTEEQLAILTEGSNAGIVIDRDNADFLLNFFWAFGLTNQNPLLTEGPMMRYGRQGVVRFASTGGWTLASKPVETLYASAPIVTLTPEQQQRLERVASNAYRPCCNNPTHFPDCNHGMALLGLLELMASQGAGEDEMYEAAKYANAFWFPQQAVELAAFSRSALRQEFAEANARLLVGVGLSSARGFQQAHQWLAERGLLVPAPQGGSGCDV